MSTQYIPDSPQEYGELIAKLKTDTTTRLRNMLTGMIKGADGALLDMADAAAFSHERDVFFMLKKKLKEQQVEVTADFISNILPLLRPYAVTQAEEAGHTAEELDDELSLIGQDDMEDIVLVKNLGTETASKFREKISHLETRLDHLALKTMDIFAKNALAPLKICQAFDDTLIDKFELSERKALFNLFKNDVAYKLDELYDSLNKRLIEAGILPKIKMSSRGIRPAAAPQPQPVDMPPEGEMHEQGGEQHYGDDQSYGGGYAAPAAPGAYGAGHHGAGAQQGGGAMPQGAGAPGGGGMPQGTGAPGGGGMPQGAGAPGGGGIPQGAGAPGGGAMPQGAGAPGGYYGSQTAVPGGNYGGIPLPPAQQGSPSGATGGGFSGTQTPPDAQGVYQHQTAGMPASQVSNTLGNFLGAPVKGGGAKAAQSGEQVSSYPVSTAEHFGHDEIISALSSIQIQPEYTSPEQARLDAEAIKQAVISVIAKSSGGIVTKRMNQIAEKTIDFIELVFDAIIEDEDISDTIKALLLRLQIPVIKASMIDQEFFIYDDHPARVLLDRIAEVGMGITGHGDEIYVQLDKIVNQLISEYELDTQVFQNALDKVNAFARERDEIARIKEEEAQQLALRDHARNSVLRSLRNITAGKTLPEAVHALVLKRWPTLMFNHYLEHGKDNDDWIIIIEVLRDVIESVQPLKSAEDLAYLIADKDHLIDRVNQQLSRTYKSKKDIQQVVSGLIETLDDMIADANFKAEEIQVAEKIVAETPREKEPVKPEPAHVPKVTLPSNIMPGMWFQIATGDGKPTRRCKLSVIIVEDEKLIFVTHDGEVVAEKSFEEFTQELDRNISKVIMGHSVFDYALNSVITKLEPTLH
jgi:predicted transcriptional regulator